MSYKRSCAILWKLSDRSGFKFKVLHFIIIFLPLLYITNIKNKDNINSKQTIAKS